MHPTETTTTARRTRSRAAVLAAALALVTALTSCQADGARPAGGADGAGTETGAGAEPNATPTDAPSTPTPDPTFDPAGGLPAEPDAMGTADAAGAEAAAQHFAEMVYAAGTSGDTSGLQALAHPDCTSCQGVVDTITQLNADRAARGFTYEDGTLTFTWVKAFEVAPGSWTVDVDFDEGPGVALDAATGAVLEEGTRVFTRHQDIDLVHDGERWLVTSTATQLVTWGDA